MGAIQMKWIDKSVKTSLSTNDLWVSMIENWGEANKEYNHCETPNKRYRPIGKCFLQMSKYIWRMLDAMKLLQERLPKKDAEEVSFSPCIDPQSIMNIWLRYKKCGKTDFSNDMENVQAFLKEFGCDEAEFIKEEEDEFPLKCLKKLNDKVNAYNRILAHLFVHEPDKLLRK